MDRRVRTGCGTCRKRHVKCDETKPTCNRCRAANFICDGYEQPRQITGSGSASSRRTSPPTGSTGGGAGNRPLLPQPAQVVDSPQSLQWHQSNWRRDELPFYHHFVTTTVLRLFRVDHVAFWRDQVAQMSSGVDVVYEALLAVGAAHRATLLACHDTNQAEVARCKVLALRAYGSALQMLPQHLGQHTVGGQWAVVVVLLFLTYFECFMENTKGALRHLWAAIQFLRESEEYLTRTEPTATVPIYDAILRLDFLAQKLVPFACSSFLRVSNIAMIERPFWSRPALEFAGYIQSDPLMIERYRLIELICGHNKLSRVIWGCWYPTSERPTRAELMGFHDEMALWKANSNATFSACPALSADPILPPTLTMSDFPNLPMPPPPLPFSSAEAAVNVIMYNGYLGCALAMISTTDPNPLDRELEAFSLVYQNMRIATSLLHIHETHKQGEPYNFAAYKPCDAVNMGISIFIYHGARRCYNRQWQLWSINALRTIGREGLSNGHAAANTLEIMCQLEVFPPPSELSHIQHHLQGVELTHHIHHPSPLGAIRDRLIPLLMPRGEDEEFLAYYLRYGLTEADSDERTIRVIARARWKQDHTGAMHGLVLERYEAVNLGEIPAPPSAVLRRGEEQQQVQVPGLDSFAHWRRAMEGGWHGLVELGAGMGTTSTMAGATGMVY